MATAVKTVRPEFRCVECGWTAPKWVGRCGECQAWGTVLETGRRSPGSVTVATAVEREAVPLSSIDGEASIREATGMGEFDRVLGGGLVAGAVVLLAGEPGVGKSTLLLDLAARSARSGRIVLYSTGEESASQVRLRAERIGALEEGLLVAAESDLGAILAQIERVKPDLLLVDSIQTVASQEVEGTPGGVSQVREVVSALIQEAKRRALPTILVGHVTKDGAVAGPRLVEHLVDVVCPFEGDPHSSLRLLRAVKNRFGSVDEVGCFALTETGIEEIPDPSGLFLSSGGPRVAGAATTVSIVGKRPLPAEIQALVAPSALATPRRATSGIDASRMAMVLAVLHRRAGLSVAGEDVYVSTVGGARVTEPAADLGLALALASALTDRPVREGFVAIGEVALSGAVRPVVAMERRLAEAARLGFTDVVGPCASIEKGASIRRHGVDSLGEAISLALE